MKADAWSLSADEFQVHKAVVQFLNTALPRDVCGPWHIPNGEKRDKVTGSRLEAMGVVRGVADLMFVFRGAAYAIEVKRAKGGGLSAHQKVWRESFESSGGKYGVARSVDDAAALCADWGIPVRVRA